MLERFQGPRLWLRDWAKVGFREGHAVEASQYFWLDHAAHYPIATLRVFARRFGQGVAPELEQVRRPALEARESERSRVRPSGAWPPARLWLEEALL